MKRKRRDQARASVKGRGARDDKGGIRLGIGLV